MAVTSKSKVALPLESALTENRPDLISGSANLLQVDPV